MFKKDGNKLVINHCGLETWIEAWGKDSVRVRVLREDAAGDAVSKEDSHLCDWALDTVPSETSSNIEINDIEISEPWHVHYENPESHVQKFQEASLTNGRMQVRVNFEGWISFWDLGSATRDAASRGGRPLATLAACDAVLREGTAVARDASAACDAALRGDRPLGFSDEPKLFPKGDRPLAARDASAASNAFAVSRGDRPLGFSDEPKLLLEEQWRNRWRIDRYCAPLNTMGREVFKNKNSAYNQINARFEAYDNEKLFGMGQYQDSHLDKKGGVWELAQRNSQASVPFVISNRGYGFLWNNPAIGTAAFGTNGTVWSCPEADKIDYWVTCGTPLECEKNYASVTGFTPMMPDFAMGFWQCKLRYRTQEEVLSVAREYKRRNLPLDVIVIDFFHWTCQGDFKFDPEDWPDPDAMVKELSSMNVKLMVSVWPTIDERSENYDYMKEHGLLISFTEGKGFNMDWMGNTVFFDTTNPETQRFVWEKCKENYFKKGIDLFWLDEAEPEYGNYDFTKFGYHLGPAMTCSNIYPKYYAQAWYDGLKESGVENPISLIRCAWAGSQRYGTVCWSGDIHSDFKSLRDNLQAGLSMATAGIPWWTTDIGGFLGGDIHNESFRELIVRWFAWGVFCPVMRLHGERPPFKALEKPYHEIRGHQIKQMESGQDNEIWSFGSEVYEMLAPLLQLRARLKPYITEVMKTAHEEGAPVMRPLFFDFNEDECAWLVEDEYMFGPKLLVAPVTDEGVDSRSVYLPVLPKGEKWIEAVTGKKYKGGCCVKAAAPLGKIPVFTRGKFEILLFN